MKFLCFRKYFWTLAALSLAPAMAFAEGTRERERAIRALVQEFDAAWDARDAVRFSACFTEDGEMWFRHDDFPMSGRNEIRTAYERILSGFTPDMKHVTVIEAMHPVARGVMLLDGNTNLIGSKPDGPGTVATTRYRGVVILEKTAEGWRILFLRAWIVPVTSKEQVE